jgi:hypothetical protein
MKWMGVVVQAVEHAEFKTQSQKWNSCHILEIALILVKFCEVRDLSVLVAFFVFNSILEQLGHNV